MTAETPPRPTARTPDKSKSGPRTAPHSSIADRAFANADQAGERFRDQVATNPLAILAGGIAVGLAAGALLPKTKLEGQYLGPIGAKLNESARAAAGAAAQAGKAELTAAGLSRVGANEQVGKLLESLGSAVTSASSAARDSRKSKQG